MRAIGSVYIELLHSFSTLQAFEPIKRNLHKLKHEGENRIRYTRRLSATVNIFQKAYLARASNKLKEKRFLLFWKAAKNCPKIVNAGVRGLEAVILCVHSQILDVDVW